MIAMSSNRVTDQTDPQINQTIQRKTELSLAFYTQHPELIDQRLKELDREWDIERALATQSSGLTLVGLTLSFLRSRRWLILPLVVQGFFLQHALQGYCPPLSLMRRMGFRTEAEINRERYALKAIRGDFHEIDLDNADPLLVHDAVRKA